jgi:hypothetical protein
MIKLFIIPAMVVMNIKLMFIKLIFHHAGSTCQKFFFLLRWVSPYDARLGLVESCTLWGCAGSICDDDDTSTYCCNRRRIPPIPRDLGSIFPPTEDTYTTQCIDSPVPSTGTKMFED